MFSLVCCSKSMGNIAEEPTQNLAYKLFADQHLYFAQSTLVQFDYRNPINVRFVTDDLQTITICN